MRLARLVRGPVKSGSIDTEVMDLVPMSALLGVFFIWPLPAIWAAPIGALWAL